MRYTQFGNTGIQISKLGFGTMRLPMKQVGDKEVVDDDLAIAMLHRAFEAGVNYVDSALFYCSNLSEITVGKALKGWRDKIYLSTKYPFGKGFRETLEEQLTKLDTDYIDFYHLHGIGEGFFTHERHDEVMQGLVKAKEEGLIKFISFSFHDRPEALPKLVDLGIFSSVLCQYNLMDRANEAGLAYAKAHGLGTVVMGPVGGGRIAGLPKETAARLGIQVKSSAELALRFVMANPNIDCALSGMSTMEQVEENIVVASNSDPLSPKEMEDISAVMIENRRLADLYCTGCNYCGPHCPQEINIPHIFAAMSNYNVYGMKEIGKQQYQEIGVSPWVKGKRADACVECGICEEHCPQKISIREQLKECHKILGG